MSVFTQIKKSFLYMVICLLLVYIVIDKSFYSNRRELAVVDQVCQCNHGNPAVAAGAEGSERKTPTKETKTPFRDGPSPVRKEIKPPETPSEGTSKTAPAPKTEVRPYSEECPLCNVFDLTQPNNFDFQCVQMRFDPPAPVCLYPLNKDIYVSASLANYGTWEGGMVKQYQQWLRDIPGGGVIDIGANLGVYSLVAAAMGREIVSVEPNIENVRRYHKAIKRGKLEDKIVLLQNAIGDNAGVAKIVYNGYNQGDTRMQKQDGANMDSTAYNNEQMYTKIIVMDDLLRFCKFSEAIMKIDIQGYEHRAFVHAARLFDKVNIHRVLMEWDMMKPIHQKKRLQPEEYNLVEKMIDFFMDRGYTPKNWDKVVLQRQEWELWPFDIIWHKENKIIQTDRTTSTARPQTAVVDYSRGPCDLCNVYNLRAPSDFDFTCIDMHFVPSTPVCLYPVNKDIYVSGSLARSGTWELGMVQTFQRWLGLYPGSGVIDVGANLGVYSLVAAAMGRKVVSVEPNIENLRRYHKAIRMGKLEDQIIVLQNAIGDNPGVAKIQYNHNNQGDTRMQKQVGADVNSETFENEQTYTKIIVMDELLRFCNFTDAIMKIDIQGFEHRAFVHADRLFAKVKIHKVMMEWDMMKPIHRNMASEEYRLVEKMIDFFTERQYTPMDWNNRVLQRKSWHLWPFDIIWHRQYQSNPVAR